ncbi:hypothetical protein DPEC_G00216150 [Dallia pectoralis]|uniref:Uncharacterized protein n=1 Tax=Dallia pectoralis TaxID=75939 RepID=A0ACC2G2P5_DALPE|nr:hypothetical protein DPEC_G00216150 [Dallia pectoralis]
MSRRTNPGRAEDTSSWPYPLGNGLPKDRWIEVSAEKPGAPCGERHQWACASVRELTLVSAGSSSVRLVNLRELGLWRGQGEHRHA